MSTQVRPFIALLLSGPTQRRAVPRSGTSIKVYSKAAAIQLWKQNRMFDFSHAAYISPTLAGVCVSSVYPSLRSVTALSGAFTL
ncbi:hypothetical protein GYMLUDRAFT_39162 [Collybiopsis luxurians FD-317 M1]|nr:hypothetical protein GYMLUDRAFT_39162 [Collybiopsis luxurians FD-317 M1]